MLEYYVHVIKLPCHAFHISPGKVGLDLLKNNHGVMEIIEVRDERCLRDPARVLMMGHPSAGLGGLCQTILSAFTQILHEHCIPACASS